jgi:hypothetical protein
MTNLACRNMKYMTSITITVVKSLACTIVKYMSKMSHRDAPSLACSRVTNLACRMECPQMMFTIMSPAKRTD